MSRILLFLSMVLYSFLQVNAQLPVKRYDMKDLFGKWNLMRFYENNPTVLRSNSIDSYRIILELIDSAISVPKFDEIEFPYYDEAARKNFSTIKKSMNERYEKSLIYTRSFQAQSVCNTFFGEYNIDEKGEIGFLSGQTLVGCHGENSRIESLFGHSLLEVYKYELNNDTLIISSDSFVLTYLKNSK